MGCAVEEYAGAAQGECKDIKIGPPKHGKIPYGGRVGRVPGEWRK